MVIVDQQFSSEVEVFWYEVVDLTTEILDHENTIMKLKDTFAHAKDRHRRLRKDC